MIINNCTQVIKEEILKERSNLEENLEFYLNFFSTDNKKYQYMTNNEKKNFKDLVKNHYYDWLELTEQIIKENPNILVTIAEFIYKQDLINYLTDLSNAIVNVHRDPSDPSKVILATKIRLGNAQFINILDHQQQALINSIKKIVYCYRSNNNCSSSSNPRIVIKL